MLARSDGVRPDTLNSPLRIQENGVTAAGLLSLVEDPQRPVDGKSLGVEDLFIAAQVEAATGPTPSCHPDDVDPDFKEGNVSDLVYGIIGPAIQYRIHRQ